MAAIATPLPALLLSYGHVVFEGVQLPCKPLHLTHAAHALSLSFSCPRPASGAGAGAGVGAHALVATSGTVAASGTVVGTVEPGAVLSTVHGVTEEQLASPGDLARTLLSSPVLDHLFLAPITHGHLLTTLESGLRALFDTPRRGTFSVSIVKGARSAQGHSTIALYTSP
jgi:hypothetical protein